MKYLLMIITTLAMIGTATATSRGALIAVVAAGAAPAATAAQDKRGENYRKPPPEKKPAEVFRTASDAQIFLNFYFNRDDHIRAPGADSETGSHAIHLRHASQSCARSSG